VLSAGTRLIGSQSVACISSETLSGSDEEDEVVASLTEMVSPFMLSSNLSWSLWFTAYNHNYRFGIVAVVWLGRRVVVLLDLQSTGRVAAALSSATLGKLFTHVALSPSGINLVPA